MNLTGEEGLDILSLCNRVGLEATTTSNCGSSRTTTSKIMNSHIVTKLIFLWKLAMNMY